MSLLVVQDEVSIESGWYLLLVDDDGGDGAGIDDASGWREDCGVIGLSLPSIVDSAEAAAVAVEVDE